MSGRSVAVAVVALAALGGLAYVYVQARGAAGLAASAPPVDPAVAPAISRSRDEHPEAWKRKVVLLGFDSCDPDLVDIAIPGNDDAMRSVRLILDRLGDAVEEGGRAWGVIAAEREKLEIEKKRTEDARRAAERQKQEVTAQWQRRLREEADRRRTGATGPEEAGPAVATEEEVPPAGGDEGANPPE